MPAFILLLREQFDTDAVMYTGQRGTETWSFTLLCSPRSRRTMDPDVINVRSCFVTFLHAQGKRAAQSCPEGSVDITLTLTQRNASPLPIQLPVRFGVR